MSDGALHLAWLQLNILDVRAAKGLSQVLGAIDLHDPFRPSLFVYPVIPHLRETVEPDPMKKAYAICANSQSINLR